MKFVTAHEDLIHDVQLDFYGKRLATCSSDRLIKVYEADDQQQQQPAELIGHNGPVWQVAWAHPKFGNILASCSYDRQVIVWKELAQAHWVQIYQYRGHDGSVNSISWCPPELGLCLACASSDESISVLSFIIGEGGWDVAKFKAHKTGVNTVSWAPFSPEDPAARRLASGGCDNAVKLWRCDESGQWVEDRALDQVHSDWVRDVAWSPRPTSEYATLASCSQDKKVVLWKFPLGLGEVGARKEILFPAPVWRVSWSVTGTILAASSGEDDVTLWKETPTGEWESLGRLGEADAAAAAAAF